MFQIISDKSGACIVGKPRFHIKLPIYNVFTNNSLHNAMHIVKNIIQMIAISYMVRQPNLRRKYTNYEKSLY